MMEKASKQIKDQSIFESFTLSYFDVTVSCMKQLILLLLFPLFLSSMEKEPVDVEEPKLKLRRALLQNENGTIKQLISLLTKKSLQEELTTYCCCNRVYLIRGLLKYGIEIHPDTIQKLVDTLNCAPEKSNARTFGLVFYSRYDYSDVLSLLIDEIKMRKKEVGLFDKSGIKVFLMYLNRLDKTTSPWKDITPLIKSYLLLKSVSIDYNQILSFIKKRIKRIRHKDIKQALLEKHSPFEDRKNEHEKN